MEEVLNYQEYVKGLFSGACYAACMSVYFTGSRDWITITKNILHGVEMEFIDGDGYVAKPLKYIQLLTGKQMKDVEKVAINGLADLPDGLSIVEYKIKPDAKASHFVIAGRDGVAYDPSGDSNTVKYGWPVSYRRYIV